MSNRRPQNSARPREENLGILLREPFRIGTLRLHERLADRGHPRCGRRTATCSSSSTTPARA